MDGTGTVLSLPGTREAVYQGGLSFQAAQEEGTKFQADPTARSVHKQLEELNHQVHTQWPNKYHLCNRALYIQGGAKVGLRLSVRKIIQ